VHYKTERETSDCTYKHSLANNIIKTKNVKTGFFHNRYLFSENRFLAGSCNDVTTVLRLMAGDDSGVN